MKLSELPVAATRLQRRWSWVWLLPVVAILCALGLIYASYSQRGIPITVDFQQGYGLKAGDAVRYRGIEAGSIHKVYLTKDLKTIRVEVRLRPFAKDLAREGSRFWIVRPQVDLSGAAGLETIIGANYLRILPGEGKKRKDHFAGLDIPPFREMMEAGGLDIVLHTPSKSGLRRGAPISYRLVTVGTISSVDLARDASAVEAQLYIHPDYAHLVREDTRFWKSGGAKFSAGWLSGLSFQMDSVQTLVAGGITLAIPPEPGKSVTAGHRFKLYDEADPEWLDWEPYLAIDKTDAATVHKRPHPLQATLVWQYESYLKRWQDGRRNGWVLPVTQGLLGSADMLSIPEDAKADSVRLLLGDNEAPLDGEPRVYASGLMMRPYAHQYPPWTDQRSVRTPEDTLIGTDFSNKVRSVTADHYRLEENHWQIDPALRFDAQWHGACVVAAKDGALLGIVAVTEGQAKVMLF
ncbi:MAG: MCE family protein [Gammaproteobacteria bacterium]|nr:MCE family protein [Gammaproteobacteria bacterium]